MSASREKKSRQGRAGEPLSARAKQAQAEQRETRRNTILFGAGAVVLLGFVAGLMVWNSGVIQRNAAAVSINGTTYPASDVAYYYYNNKAGLQGSSGIDTTVSLRGQAYSTGEGTWFDKEAEDAIDTLAKVAAFEKEAKAAGFDGGEEVENTVNEAMNSLTAASSSSGYTVSQYLKAVFGSLMTRSDYVRNLRMAALADAYYNSRLDTSGYTAEELEAARLADPDDYDMVAYEYAVFYTPDVGSDESEADGGEAASDGTEDAEDAEAAEDAASAKAKELADSALAAVKQGRTLEAAAAELGGVYNSGTTYHADNELSNWLFDSGRKDGDSTVLDYYGMGYGVYIFHSRALADFHTVSVRHILVDTEEKAQELLAQYNEGERTEDAFAALAKENSTDTSSAEDGGLYTSVFKGQMVKPFEEWCFDASRQSGDTGIVETDYGYHVMYFVETDPFAYWEAIAVSKLASEWSALVTEGIQTEQLDGMKYIDP